MHLKQDLPQQFADRMGQMIGPDFPSDLGVSVSGGGDSMAMLHLAAGWARVYGVRLWVVTVDHGLRDASAAEAVMVAAECAALGLPHNTLRWTGWDGRGNVQDAARMARRDLIGRWHGVCRHVLMGHTRDDQAETLLMRLARGSGVDGLAAMADATRVAQAGPVVPVITPQGPPWPDPPPQGFDILRPLLDTDRAALRHYLTTLHIPFVDDPSNDDPTYARVRMRRLIGVEGLEVATLSATARRMARAQTALRRRAHDVARDLMRPDHTAPGAVALDRDGFAAIEEETQLRLLAGALQMVATATYRPRADALESALNRALGGGTTTLHGTIIVPKGNVIHIAREAARTVAVDLPMDAPAIWDHRWHILPCDRKGLTVAALGEAGLVQIKDRRPGTVPRAVLASLPALWDGGDLLACPSADFGPDIRMTLRPEAGNLPDYLLAH